MWVHVCTLQVLSARYSLVFVVTFAVWPLESSGLYVYMCSPNDVALENAINLKLKPLLMGSFLKVVKLNCRVQGEGGGVKDVPGGPGLPLTSRVPCWNAGFAVGLLCLFVCFI